MAKITLSQLVTDIRNSDCETVDIRRVTGSRRISAIWGVGRCGGHVNVALISNFFYQSYVEPTDFPTLSAVLDLMGAQPAELWDFHKFVLTRDELVRLVEQDQGVCHGDR